MSSSGNQYERTSSGLLMTISFLSVPVPATSLVMMPPYEVVAHPPDAPFLGELPRILLLRTPVKKGLLVHPLSASRSLPTLPGDGSRCSCPSRAPPESPPRSSAPSSAPRTRRRLR